MSDRYRLFYLCKREGNASENTEYSQNSLILNSPLFPDYLKNVCVLPFWLNHLDVVLSSENLNWSGVMLRNVVWSNVMWCNVVRCMSRCDGMRCVVVWYDAMFCHDIGLDLKIRHCSLSLSDQRLTLYTHYVYSLYTPTMCTHLFNYPLQLSSSFTTYSYRTHFPL